MAEKTLEKSGEKLASSAAKLERSNERVKDSADRRTELAADRTVFAAERTYAAWVRTGLVALASGIGARKLLEGLVPGWIIAATGTALILFSAFCPAAEPGRAAPAARRSGRPQPISRACGARRSARRLVWGERVVGSELARLLS